MPTNLALDDTLIKKIVKLGKFRSKKDAVNTAMSEYVQRHSQASIIELFGTIDYDEDYDYKKLRSRKMK
jgi:Bacterial antitoxin of type II TA system, VapB